MKVSSWSSIPRHSSADPAPSTRQRGTRANLRRRPASARACVRISARPSCTPQTRDTRVSIAGRASVFQRVRSRSQGAGKAQRGGLPSWRSSWRKTLGCETGMDGMVLIRQIRCFGGREALFGCSNRPGRCLEPVRAFFCKEPFIMSVAVSRQLLGQGWMSCKIVVEATVRWDRDSCSTVAKQRLA